MPNLVIMSLMKYYRMLKNDSLSAYNISELFRENQKGKVKLAPTQIRIKFGLLPSKINLIYLLQRKPFKNDEKYFLFHLKSSFHFQDICIFDFALCLCR